MIRCILVDDEPLVRLGIRKKVDFAVYGFEVLGEADHALDALVLVEKLKPDVIFTDIRMPVMDGIELLHKAREIVPELIGVMISGYRDFEYARRAIQAGAFDYIAKPIVPENLIETLKKLRDQIHLRRSEQTKLMRNKLMAWFSHGDSTTELAEIKGLFSLHIFYNGNLNTKDSWIDLVPYETNLSFYQYKSKLPIQSITSLWHPDLSHKRELILFTQWVDIANEHNMEEWTTILTQSLGDQSCLWRGCTSYCTSADQLRLEYESIRKSVETNRYIQLPMFIAQPFSVLSLSGKRSKWNDWQQMMLTWLNKIIETGQTEAVFAWIDELTLAQHTVPYDWLESFLFQAIVFICKQKLQVPKEEDSKNMEDLVLRELRTALNVEQAVGLLLSQCHLLIDEWESKYGRSSKSTMEQLMKYVELHYAESLSISTLAEQFGFHRGYLTRLFKEKYEMTFTDFIVRYRLEIAVKLLSQTKRSVKDIAAQVGYEDTSYFMRLFKKQVHMTPSEYRETIHDSTKE